MADLIAIQNVAKTFHLHQLEKTIHALKPTSFSVAAGEFVGITGKAQWQINHPEIDLPHLSAPVRCHCVLIPHGLA